MNGIVVKDFIDLCSGYMSMTIIDGSLENVLFDDPENSDTDEEDIPNDVLLKEITQFMIMPNALLVINVGEIL